MPSSIYRPSAQVNGVEVPAVQVSASLTVPWRRATWRGAATLGDATVAMSQSGDVAPVFVGLVDDPGAVARGTGEMTARGLPDWRREVGPLTFQDVRLETVLTWIAGACGGRVQVQAAGSMRRHYVLRRGRAHQLVTEALGAWRDMSALIELDGGTLYIGKETESPHARAGTQFSARRAVNVIGFKQSAPDHWSLTLPLTPHLRVGHRGTVDHPQLSGTVRIVDCDHVSGPRHFTRLEVTPT